MATICKFKHMTLYLKNMDSRHTVRICLLILSTIFFGCESLDNSSRQLENPDDNINQPRLIVMLPNDFDLSQIARFEVSVFGPDIPLFNSEPRIFVGGEPVSVAFHDMNHDGVGDIITANSLSDDVSILLGRNDGSFQELERFRVGSVPRAMEVGDVDGDGNTDVVTANLSGDVSMLFGDGMGGLSVPQLFSVGAAPSALALGDDDGNDVIDFVVTANSSVNNVSVLFRGVSGDFGAPKSFAVGAFPSALALGDVNGDTKLDLVVANRRDNNVSVLMRNDSGSFGQRQNFPVGTAPSALLLDDVNGDSYPDVITANSGSNTVSVLLNDTIGSFTHRLSDVRLNNNDSSDLSALALGNLNHEQDSHLDLIVANRSDGNLSLLFGNGMGFDRPGTPIVVGGDPASVVSDMVDGDDTLDVITANSSSDDISILFGDGKGGFPVQPGIEDVGESPNVLAVGKLDDDNLLDLVVGNQSVDRPELSDVILSVLLGRGGGNFEISDQLIDLREFFTDEDEGISAIVLGHLNRDIKKGMNDPLGPNEDNFLDLVVLHPDSPGRVLVLAGQGDGRFIPQIPVPMPVGDRPLALALGDLNSDGLLDIVIANNGTGDISVLLNQGHFGFRNLEPRITLGGRPSAVALGALNQDDEHLDLVITDQVLNHIEILFGKGDGIFERPEVPLTFNVGEEPSSVALGMMDGDKQLDVVTANAGSDNVSILYGTKNGTFSEQVIVSVNDSPSSVKLADLNEDRRLDIITTNEFSNDVSVLLGQQGRNLFLTQLSIPIAGRPRAGVIGQFDDDNGNGRVEEDDFPDLVIANRTTRNIVALLSEKGLKRLRVTHKVDVFTLDRRAFLGVELTLEENQPAIPEGRNRLFVVRTFSSDNDIEPNFIARASVETFNLQDTVLFTEFLPINENDGQ